jgi:hypothetical protein
VDHGSGSGVAPDERRLTNRLCSGPFANVLKKFFTDRP